jgi:hypothetical protein
MGFLRKNDNKEIEFLPREGIRLLDLNKVIKINTNEKELNNLPNKTWSSNTIFKFTDRTEIISSKYIYKNPMLIIGTSNKIIDLIEIPIGQDFYFNDIDLSKEDWKKTLKELEKLGYKPDRYRSFNYEFDSLNLCLRVVNDELEVVDVYTLNYFNDIEDRLSNYNSSLKIENENYVYYLTRK